MFKSSSHLTECILEPSSSRAFFGDQSPFSHAFETGMNFRTFLQLSFDQEVRLRRFIAATECLSKIGASDQGLTGFNWGTIGNGLLVDVGGGVGHVALNLAKIYPKLRIVLQDRAEVIVQANTFWQKHFPQAILSNRVVLETHNVFDPQKRKGIRAFFVRFVVREWNDEQAITILANLSQAASSSTKLILVERTVTNWSQQSVHDCPLQSWEILKDVNVPKNVQSSFCHNVEHEQVLEETGRPLIDLLDAQLMLYGSGRERTLEELVLLLSESSWKVEKINRPGTSSLTQLICKPINKSDNDASVEGWAKKPSLADGPTVGTNPVHKPERPRSPKEVLPVSVLGQLDDEVKAQEKKSELIGSDSVYEVNRTIDTTLNESKMKLKTPPILPDTTESGTEEQSSSTENAARAQSSVKSVKSKPKSFLILSEPLKASDFDTLTKI